MLSTKEKSSTGKSAAKTELAQAFSTAQTISALAKVRSALSIYYGDLEGLYPNDPSELAKDSKYIDEFPEADTGFHHASMAIQRMTGEEYAAQSFSDAGGWLYVTSGRSRGTIKVNCTHTNTEGKQWASY
jgi:hypothetical protein